MENIAGLVYGVALVHIAHSKKNANSMKGANLELDANLKQNATLETDAGSKKRAALEIGVILGNGVRLFAAMSDEDIIATTKDGALADYAANQEILKTDAPAVFNDMCDIWESVGETVNRDLVNTLFDTKYIDALGDKYSSLPTAQSTSTITAEQKESVKEVEALMTKTSTINFMPDTAKFLDNAAAAATLDEFVSIAKTLDGTIIQIEGNINASTDTEEGRKLSEERAKTVANYFIANGIDPNRIIVVGNGNTKMIGDMNTEEGKIKNRRTDVFFKTIEE